METPEIIRSLAALRLEEAEILVQHDKPDGAFYMAGYSVELSLKAKIAERLGIPGIFNEQDTTQQFTGLRELRTLLKTHNLTLLFVIGGIRVDFERKRTADATFNTANSWLTAWSERLRYRSPGTVNKAGVEQFLATLGGPGGLLQWIKQQ